MLGRRRRDGEAFLLLLILLLTDMVSVRAATHWMVTEDGLSIQAAVSLSIILLNE